MIGEIISAGADLIGGMISGNQAYDRQKEFAQKGIRWKVKDAQAAGIHPLYALGANTVSYSNPVGDLGTGLANAGQDIGRAVSQAMTPEHKASATLSSLAVERAGLENDLLRSQIRAINAPGSAAGLPSAVGDNADPLKMAGVAISRNPGWSDAQDFENRYGELSDWVVGPFIAAGDANATIRAPSTGKAVDEYMRKGWSDWFYGR